MVDYTGMPLTSIKDANNGGTRSFVTMDPSEHPGSDPSIPVLTKGPWDFFDRLQNRGRPCG